MKYFFWALIAFFTFGIQGSISLFDITPNFTVLLTCYAGIRGGAGKGLLMGSIIGLIEDSLSGSILGPHLLSKGLIGYLSAFLHSRLFLWTPVLGILTLIILTIADGFAVYTARSVFSTMPSGIGTAAFIIGMQSLFNAPFGVFLKKMKD